MNPKDYVVKDDITVEDVDLDQEPITLSDGRVLDEKAAEQYGREVADRAAARRPGRPSISGRAGVHSPQLSARVSPDMKAAIDKLARRQGKRSSDVFREALEEYVAAHGG